MSTNHQHIIYSARDIKRYLEGNMSSDEMHAIEKAALDDPLLAEAIEGYADAAEEDWNSILAELKTKVSVKENSPVIDIKSANNFRWWKAAAAVLLLGATGTIAYVMNAKKENQAVTKTENLPVLDSSVVAKIKADSVDEKTVAVNDASKAQSLQLSTETESSRGSGLVSDKTYNNSKQGDLIYQPNFTPAETEKAHDGVDDRSKKNEEDHNNLSIQNTAPAPSASNNSTAEVANSVFEQNKAASTEPSVLAHKKQADASNNLIKQQYQLKGSVLNQKGEPVSFAGLKLSSPTKQFITADAKGYFNITSADSAVSVEIAAAGYTPGRFKLNAGTNNGVVLQQSNAALNEVTISSNVPKEKLAKKRISTVDEELEETAEPTGGWDSYNEYLDNNVHLPGNNQNVHGTVEAIVKVNRKGEVADVKITQSLNAECDKEAVRVIKSGPGWKVKSGKKGYSKVKVRFQQQD